MIGKMDSIAQLIFCIILLFLLIYCLRIVYLDCRQFINDYFINPVKLKEATRIIKYYGLAIPYFVLYFIKVNDNLAAFYYVIIATLFSWFVYYFGLLHFLKCQYLSKLVKSTKRKYLHSIANAFAAWSTIISVIWTLSKIKELPGIIIEFSKFANSLIILYRPINDIYFFIKSEIKKEKSRKKEEMKYDYYNYD